MLLANHLLFYWQLAASGSFLSWDGSVGGFAAHRAIPRQKPCEAPQALEES